MKITINQDEGVNVVIGDFSKKRIDGDRKPDEPSMLVVREPLQYLHQEGRCAHINTQIHEDLAEIVCRDCGEKLNPIWVLIRMAKAETKWAISRAEYIKAREQLAERSRCKCIHCGSMTPIRR